MGGARILSDAQLVEMAELRERGWSCQRIARHFTLRGTVIGQSAIQWQCLRIGADAPGARQSLQRTEPTMRGGHVVRPFRSDEDDRLLALEATGTPVTRIADALGRKPQSVRARLMILARRDARAEAAHG